MERSFVLTDLPHELLSLPFLLYAETHYRFKYFFSYLKKSEPEIIADAPQRLEPGFKLPVLVLIKDADIYPILLREITITLLQNEKIIAEQSCLTSPELINKKYWWKIYSIDVEAYKEWITCDVRFRIERNGKLRSYHNDNYRTSSHTPLRVYIAHEVSPSCSDLYLGDCHTHSSYTEDQVEFGAPLEPAIQLSKAMGLSFFGVTDHSYDLDDRLDNYLINDPNLPKWRMLQQDVDKLNAQDTDFAVIRGEEVTCHNAKGENVHLLLLGNRKFYPGSGDSAENWFHTNSENSIDEILGDIAKEVLTFAAHPRETIPILQRRLIGRGQWEMTDLNHSALTGIQFANGIHSRGFDEGYQFWIRQLLSGKRLIAIAGNDAHGNFNRFRQIGIPFFRIREGDQQLFGLMRTGVFLRSQLSESAIISALRNGECIMTDGPVCTMEVRTDVGDISTPLAGSTIGHTCKGTDFHITLRAFSSCDFGEIQKVKLLQGIYGESSERVVFEENGSLGIEIERSMQIKIREKCYFRSEIYTSAINPFSRKSHFCFSNPIWAYPAF